MPPIVLRFFEFIFLFDQTEKPSPKQRKGVKQSGELAEKPTKHSPNVYWTIDRQRDPMASANLAFAYLCKKFRGLSPRFNLASCDWPEGPLELTQVNTATRLPISDAVDKPRKAIRRMGGPIETALINRALAYFMWLDRQRARLTREIAALLPESDRGLADVYFRAYGPTLREFGETYDRRGRGRRPRRVHYSKTTRFGYVLRERLWQGGPLAVMAWGPDAETTLLFSYLLRDRHPELLDGIGLSIVQMDGEIPSNWHSFDFLDEWQTRVILDRAATKVAAPSTREEATRPAPFFAKDYLSKMSLDEAKVLMAELTRKDTLDARATIELMMSEPYLRRSLALSTELGREHRRSAIRA